MARQPTDSDKFKRHLGALMRKNWLLKKRHPCGLFCELFLAIGATGMLAFARWLTRDVKAFEQAAQLHVDKAMPVRLPDCAEFISECKVRLVEGKASSPMCIKDITYGCTTPDKEHHLGHEDAKGVWVSLGCNGTFDLGPDTAQVRCSSMKSGRIRRCHFGVPGSASAQPDDDDEDDEEDDRMKQDLLGTPKQPSEAVCSKVNDNQKKDCGYFGITAEECHDRKCCYKPVLSFNFTPWCFHAPEPMDKRKETQIDSSSSSSSSSDNNNNNKLETAAAAARASTRRGFRGQRVAEEETSGKNFPRESESRYLGEEEDEENEEEDIVEEGEDHSPSARRLFPGRGTGAGGGHQNAGLSLSPMAMLSTLQGDADMRRLSGVFAIAPADGGGREFLYYLRQTKHPWAPFAKLFASKEAVQAHLTDKTYPFRNMTDNTTTSVCGAVIFDTPSSDEDVEYTLRFNASLSSGSTLPGLGALLSSTRIKTHSLVDSQASQRASNLNLAGMTWYTQSGFLALQRSVDSFLEYVALHGYPVPHPPIMQTNQSGARMLGEDDRLHVIVPFPTPGKRKDIFAILMPIVLAEFLLMSLTYSVNRMITTIVHEREARLRDGMRMMGMHPMAFYLSWILTYMLIYLFVCLGVMSLLTFGSVLSHSSPTLMFLWLMLFSAASISYALVISTFFSKAKTAATVGSVIFYSSSYLVHLTNAGSSSRFLRLLSMLPPVCFELSTKLFAELESQGIGLTWSNITATEENWSLLEGCLLLAFDAVALLLVFLYLDQVAPRDVGLQKPWYFPLLPSFWKSVFMQPDSSKTSSIASRRSSSFTADPEASSLLIERDFGEAAATMARNGQIVELQGLSKVFGNFHAVKSLDLVMLQSEIFALLGHNGAGKTTTLAMMTGLLPLSSGSCTIFGHCLQEEPTQVQKLLGVCPQHDVLWDELSCSEHLTLFAQFKGVEQDQVAPEVEGMLSRVGLSAAGAVDRLAGRLSGGMKRKLSLGIAFLGGSKLVVLDEPTSGLDPYSRRMVWELLRAMKHGRVTVLSTHYMDEADILGDRIAILHEGSLRCCGSPQFLKRAYDCGYNIVFVKKPGCDVEAVLEAVTRHMPEMASEVTPLSNSGSELIVQAPFAAARHFPQVLGSLEQSLHQLKLESYGVSVTTLEEVFLKVASGERVSNQEGASPVSTDFGSQSPTTSASIVSSDRERGEQYVELADMKTADKKSTEEPHHSLSLEGYDSELERQKKASSYCSNKSSLRPLLLKRVRYGLRDRRGFLCQLCLPAGTLLVLLSLISSKFFSSMPSLKLDVGRYNENFDGTPQNVVDFTHLSSVSKDDAESLLEPGKSLWHGDLRHISPHQTDDVKKQEEQWVGSTLPELIHLFRPQMQKAGRLKAARNASAEILPLLLSGAKLKARRLVEDPSEDLGAAGDDALFARRLGEAGGAAWSNWRLAQLATDAEYHTGGWLRLLNPEDTVSDVAGDSGSVEHLEDNAPRRLGLVDLLRQAEITTQRDSNGKIDADFVFGNSPNTSLDPSRTGPTVVDKNSCKKASEAELMVWSFLDAKRTNQIDESTLTKMLEKGLKMGGVDLKTEAKASTSNGAEEETEALTTFVADLSKVLMLVMDINHDKHIQVEEFCEGLSPLRDHIYRFWGLAEDFSLSILNNTGPCPRYGAYFVTAAGGDVLAGKSGNSNITHWVAGSDAVIFVNTSSPHAAPSFQAALSNSRWKRAGLKKKVTVSVHPFPQTSYEQQSLEQAAVFLIAILATFCLSFIPGSIVHFVVKERTSGAQQLQILSGASRLSYWSSNLIYDCILYIVPAACVPLALNSFGFDMILAGDCGWALAAVLTAFGPALASFSYCVAFLFKDHSKASNAVLSFCLIGASVLSTILFVLSVINYDPTYKYPTQCDRATPEHPNGVCKLPAAQAVHKIVGPLFRLVPTVCVYQALFAIALLANLNMLLPQGSTKALSSILGDNAPSMSFSAFAYEWAGEPLQYLIFEAIFFFVLTLTIDVFMHSPRLSRWIDCGCIPAWPKKWRLRRRRAARERVAVEGASEALAGGLDEEDEEDEESHVGDPTVEVERQRSAFLQPKDMALHVSSLHKTYRPILGCAGSVKHAVKGITFCVETGEVFGLLGHNGAGKTSALKCLVGEAGCSSGDIHVGGHHMEKDTAKARQKVGYCPQFDALLELLTVKDHLDLFSSLKGLDSEAANAAVIHFKLKKLANRRADVLSGGNKRKLSAAIALMGQPSLAVLDEPSCGLDPAARRALWSAVQRAVQSSHRGGGGCAVLLTTHSMEEAEALSNRLGIMAQGRLLTIGTGQQIKQRYGACHELYCSLLPETEENMRQSLLQLGGGSTPIAVDAPIALEALNILLDRYPTKKKGYSRPRCVVRAQVEALGHVEAATLSEWWVQQTRGETIEQFLRTLVGEGVELSENFGPYWRFRLPHGGCGLPELFRHLEESSKRLGIAEYTLSQATLEQIFNSIAGEAERAVAEHAVAESVRR